MTGIEFSTPEDHSSLPGLQQGPLNDGGGIVCSSNKSARRQLTRLFIGLFISAHSTSMLTRPPLSMSLPQAEHFFNRCSLDLRELLIQRTFFWHIE